MNIKHMMLILGLIFFIVILFMVIPMEAFTQPEYPEILLLDGSGFYKYNLTSNDLQKISLNFSGSRGSYLEDNNTIAYFCVNNGKGLCIYNILTSEIEQIVRNEDVSTEERVDRYIPLWLDEYNIMYFGEDSMNIVNILTKEVIPFTFGTNSPTNVLSLSRDKTMIVYDSEDSIFIYNIESSKSVRIATGKFPSWSPIRDEFVFVRDKKIYIYNFETGVETEIAKFQGTTYPENHALHFTWANSGDYLIYATDQDNADPYVCEIHAIDRNGNKLRRVNLDRYGFCSVLWWGG